MRSYRDSFHHLTPDHHTALAGAFEALQEHGVDSLLYGLAEEEDWEIRKPFLGLLTARKKAVQRPRKTADPPRSRRKPRARSSRSSWRRNGPHAEKERTRASQSGGCFSSHTLIRIVWLARQPIASSGSRCDAPVA